MADWKQIMTHVRLIPCLDVEGGRVVKGVGFKDLVDWGDPVGTAARYAADGADEIVFLDITASVENRKTLIDLVSRTADSIFVPLTVGGGVGSVDAAVELLRAGADKVAVNSAAVKNPDLINDLARTLGSQSVVVSIDASLENGRWQVWTHGGRKPTPLDAVEWAAECVSRGAGELLITSIDRDGTRSGYDLELLARVRGRVDVPLIASGGAGSAAHLVEGAQCGATGLLLAGMLHDGTSSIPFLRDALSKAGVSVRPLPTEDKTETIDVKEFSPDRGIASDADLDSLRFDPLIPVIAQSVVTGEVLMQAFANREALERTLETGEMHYYSRSRQSLWHKGETSGHTQRCHGLYRDCDGDSVLAHVDPAGPACHTGERSCFGEGSEPALASTLRTIEERSHDLKDQNDLPNPTYTQRLLQDENLRVKKLGEETAELIYALIQGSDQDAAGEAADLIYHVAVALEARGIGLQEALAELERRSKRRLRLDTHP